MNPTKAAPHIAKKGRAIVHNSTIIAMKAETIIEAANKIDETKKLIIKSLPFEDIIYFVVLVTIPILAKKYCLFFQLQSSVAEWGFRGVP